MGFGESKTFFGGPCYFPYMMGRGQGNRAALPLWIQLSPVLVNVYKQLNLGPMIQDPITAEMIHSMGALFVYDTNLLLKVIGVLRNVTKGLRWLHTTFVGFGHFSLPTEQLIS